MCKAVIDIVEGAFIDVGLILPSCAFAKIRQSCIYESPFYYIDYCLAQVVAFEFLAEMQKDYDGALKRYMDHCKRGGKYAFNKLVSLAGLKSPFEDGALDEIAGVVGEIIDSCRK